jgi:hypothetical protein
MSRGLETMAVKKTAASKSGRTATATRTKSAAKKRVVKASAATRRVNSETTAKAGTPKARAGAKKAATKKVVIKKAAPAVKLTDKQLDLLKTVRGTKDSGYLADKKAEAKTLDALASRKLIKKGAKDKASGHVRYHVSKAGEKHVASQRA